MTPWLRRQGGRFLDWLVDRLAEPVRGRLRTIDGRRAEAVLARVPLRGAGVRVGGRVTLTGPERAAIGNNVHIDDGVYIRAEGGLVIGDNTHISRDVTIYTVSYEYEGEALPHDGRHRYRPVTIGRDVWIGRGVHVAPGARIGDGAVVGIGAVVAGEVPPGAVVAAPKARILSERDPDHYAGLRDAEQFGGASGARLGADDVAAFVPTLDGVRPFFVASTGRSGSTTLARTLNQHPDVTCLHEPRTQLIRLSTEWAHGLRDRSAIRDDLDAIYRASVSPGPVFGESDQNLAVLLDPLLDLYPEARVIWLIRDGRSFVTSAHRKGWYADGPAPDGRRHVWDDYRLRGDLCGEVSEAEWADMSAFAKSCWYWSFANRSIEAVVGRLGAGRALRVRLEELADETPALFDLLGVAPHPVTVRRHNAGRGRAEAWSSADRDSFQRWCGDGMDRWYPSWREAEPVGAR